MCIFIACSLWATVTITMITVAIFELAIAANIIVLTGCLKISDALRKLANYLLVNLTISEFVLALLVIPLQTLVHFIKVGSVSDGGVLCVLVGILTNSDDDLQIREPMPCYSGAVELYVTVNRDRICWVIACTWLQASAFNLDIGFAMPRYLV